MLKEIKSICFKTQTHVILAVAAFIMLTGNMALFDRILEVYPFSASNAAFLISLTLFFTVLTTLFFLALCYGQLTRWVLAIFLIISALSAHYMDQFGVIVDVMMIDNIIQTNSQELAGLVSASLLFRTLLFGVTPAWLVIKYCPKGTDFRSEFGSRLHLLGILLLSLFLLVAPFTAGYASFIREHKITRYYANPTYPTYSFIKYFTQQIHIAKAVPLKQIAQDAKIIGPCVKTELMVLVIGETARADRFSLNGYHRETNPLLAKQDVVSFSSVSSCGTSTSVSVPCMFSSLGRKSYDKETALNQENVLDVLFDHGVQILWRDNNSDSKGVATRMKYEDFKSPTLNPNCEGECRDIGMLSGLDAYIKARKGKDILIVLHQMGNHGPEYYRRYPKQFEKFKPMCMTGELRDCSQQEIDNSYDNAILYTDYFLSEVINFLKQYDNDYATAMLYVSDHGESLGEHGLYLHAAPYLIAPKEQTHVPAIVWVGKSFDYTLDQLKPYQHYPLSHDDVFCSLLVAYELDTKQCAAKHNWLMQNSEIRGAMESKQTKG
jgi:lipid A ethanolaminephosphotransferase